MVSERSLNLSKPLLRGLYRKVLVLVISLSVKLSVCECGGIAPQRCLVWGPGLRADSVLPVRYFFIQAVNSEGEKLTLSTGKINSVTL